MSTLSLSRLAMKHIRGHAAETVYDKTGLDWTRPLTINGVINERCNIKCRYCESWRLPHYRDEMTIEEWQQALLSVREFLGRYTISFTGGEPFIKKGFVDLLAWCRQNDISSGVTTNGTALAPRQAEKLAAAHPFNVNISVDAASAEILDYLRGRNGLYEQISTGIRNLVEARRAHGVRFPIIIKPTVTSRNFRTLPQLVEWVQTIGADALNLQPVERWTRETYDELWIETDEIPELEAVAERLIRMKRDGAPILNSETNLQLLGEHFREAPVSHSARRCRMGTRNFQIMTNGDVQISPWTPVVGNINHQSARAIWYGKRARAIRRRLSTCQDLTLATSMSPISLVDKVKIGLTLFYSRR